MEELFLHPPPDTGRITGEAHRPTLDRWRYVVTVPQSKHGLLRARYLPSATYRSVASYISERKTNSCPAGRRRQNALKCPFLILRKEPHLSRTQHSRRFKLAIGNGFGPTHRDYGRIARRRSGIPPGRAHLASNTAAGSSLASCLSWANP